MNSPIVRGVASEQEEQTLCRIATQAFGFPPSRWGQFVEIIGRDNLRVLCEGPHVIGGLAIYPLTQWFGGKAIPMAGIAMVAVAPEKRDRGLAMHMLAETMRQLRQSGFSIATLYPSTQVFYRKLGFELAGSAYLYRYATSLLSRLRQRVAMHRVDVEDYAPLARLDLKRGVSGNGLVQRSDAFWQRLLRVEQDNELFAYLLGEIDSPEGYLIYERLLPSNRSSLTRSGAQQEIVRIRDMVATTPSALESIGAFFHGHRSVIDVIEWTGPARDPLMLILAENAAQVVRPYRWMLRLLDVKQALLQRGYPSISEVLSLDVVDDLIPENSGSFGLRLTQGTPSIEESGSAKLETEVRGLAPLYSSCYSAHQLGEVGLISADDHALQVAERIFAGREPWMPDRF